MSRRIAISIYFAWGQNGSLIIVICVLREVSESQKSHQSSCQVGTHRTRDLTREIGELLPGSSGQRPRNLGKGQDRAKHDNKQNKTKDNTKTQTDKSKQKQ